MVTALKEEKIPNYYHVAGKYTIDGKGRLKLPVELIQVLKERDMYNLANTNAPELNEILAKPNLDWVIYLTVGTFEGPKPFFTLEAADRVFIYSETDAKKFIDEIVKGKLKSQAPILRTADVDTQRRIQLNALELMILSNQENEVYLSAHPGLDCITISKPFKPNYNNPPAQLGPRSLDS